MARNSCAMNMEIRRKETALPFVSLEWGQGRERRVPESWNGIQTVMMMVPCIVQRVIVRRVVTSKMSCQVTKSHTTQHEQYRQ